MCFGATESVLLVFECKTNGIETSGRFSWYLIQFWHDLKQNFVVTYSHSFEVTLKISGNFNEQWFQNFVNCDHGECLISYE